MSGSGRVPPGSDRAPPGSDLVPPGSDWVPPGSGRAPPGLGYETSVNLKLAEFSKPKKSKVGRQKS